MYIGNPVYQVAFLTDQFSGNGTTTAFTMSVAPANTASVLVAVSGVLQDPSTYSVVGTTLTFSSAPPVGTGNISARYLGIPASNVTTTAYRTVTTFTATASQTTFTPPSYTVGFINVYRNGVLLTPTSDYTASNGTTVVLASGAASGDTVIVESFLVSSVLNAIPNTAGSVGASNLAGGSVTQAALAGNNVAGNGPLFSVTMSTNQSVTSATSTKLQFNTVVTDTNSNYSTSNYRFTPTVPGYYLFGLELYNQATNLTESSGGIFKNGVVGRYVFDLLFPSVAYAITGGQALIYCNGTTDYVEAYTYIVGTSPSVNSNSNYTTFYGFLARSA